MVASYRVMPLLSMRGRPEVRLGGFASLAGRRLPGSGRRRRRLPRDRPQPRPTPQPSPIRPDPRHARPTDQPATSLTARRTEDLDAMLAGLNAPRRSGGGR